MKYKTVDSDYFQHHFIEHPFNWDKIREQNRKLSSNILLTIETATLLGQIMQKLGISINQNLLHDSHEISIFTRQKNFRT